MDSSISENESTELSQYVDDKIMRITFRAKNFTKEEMDKVDDYCKIHFGNDRKKMILTLITLVESNYANQVLNEKLNAMYTELSNHIDNLYGLVENPKEAKEIVSSNKAKKISWKGLSG